MIKPLFAILAAASMATPALALPAQAVGDSATAPVHGPHGEMQKTVNRAVWRKYFAEHNQPLIFHPHHKYRRIVRHAHR